MQMVVVSGIVIAKRTHDHDIPGVTGPIWSSEILAPGWRWIVPGFVTVSIPIVLLPFVVSVSVVMPHLVLVSLPFLIGISAGFRITLAFVVWCTGLPGWGLITLAACTAAVGSVPGRLLMALAGFIPVCAFMGFPVVASGIR
jgi:hypothetical protein